MLFNEDEFTTLGDFCGHSQEEVEEERLDLCVVGFGRVEVGAAMIAVGGHVGVVKDVLFSQIERGKALFHITSGFLATKGARKAFSWTMVKP